MEIFCCPSVRYVFLDLLTLNHIMGHGPQKLSVCHKTAGLKILFYLRTKITNS